MPWESAMTPLSPTARVMAASAAATLRSRLCSDTSALSQAGHVSAAAAPSLPLPRIAADGRVGRPRRRAAEAIVDGGAESRLGNGHDGDAGKLRTVSGAECGEEIARGFDEIAVAAQPQHPLGAAGRALAEGEEGLAIPHLRCREAKRQRRRIMRREQTRRGGARGIACAGKLDRADDVLDRLAR